MARDFTAICLLDCSFDLKPELLLGSQQSNPLIDHFIHRRKPTGSNKALDKSLQIVG